MSILIEETDPLLFKVNVKRYFPVVLQTKSLFVGDLVIPPDVLLDVTWSLAAQATWLDELCDVV